MRDTCGRNFVTTGSHLTIISISIQILLRLCFLLKIRTHIRQLDLGLWSVHGGANHLVVFPSDGRVNTAERYDMSLRKHRNGEVSGCSKEVSRWDRCAAVLTTMPDRSGSLERRTQWTRGEAMIEIKSRTVDSGAMITEMGCDCELVWMRDV